MFKFYANTKVTILRVYIYIYVYENTVQLEKVLYALNAEGYLKTGVMAITSH